MGKKRSSPKCAACRNHNIVTDLIGHKHFCPYRKCPCAPCGQLKERQKVMAEQVSLHRLQDLEEKNGRIVYKKTNIDTKEGKPLCRRCRNHGEKRRWKGHKHSCPYKLCTCDQCHLIKARSALSRPSISTPATTSAVQHGFTPGAVPGFSTLKALFPNHNPSMLAAVFRIYDNDLGQTIRTIHQGYIQPGVTNQSTELGYATSQTYPNERPQETKVGISPFSMPPSQPSAVIQHFPTSQPPVPPPPNMSLAEQPQYMPTQQYLPSQQYLPPQQFMPSQPYIPAQPRDPFMPLQPFLTAQPYMPPQQYNMESMNQAGMDGMWQPWQPPQSNYPPDSKDYHD